jgi:hypothetical protein
MDGWMERLRDGQTDRQTDRPTDGPTGRPADRQTVNRKTGNRLYIETMFHLQFFCPIFMVNASKCVLLLSWKPGFFVWTQIFKRQHYQNSCQNVRCASRLALRSLAWWYSSDWVLIRWYMLPTCVISISEMEWESKLFREWRSPRSRMWFVHFGIPLRELSLYVLAQFGLDHHMLPDLKVGWGRYPLPSWWYCNDSLISVECDIPIFWSNQPFLVPIFGGWTPIHAFQTLVVHTIKS